MGIIGSKLPEYKKRASESFTKALKKAQTLDLYDSLKEIYWETAKVYARRDEYETVKKCQEMEYSLAIKHNKKDDEVNCLLEKSKPSFFLFICICN
jgi:hypothetical protein